MSSALRMSSGSMAFAAVSAPSGVQGRAPGLRLSRDMLVEDKLIIELKSVEQIRTIHEAQLLTYMRLAGVKTGLLINFNVTKLKNGIERFVL
jgi:GxxExxY protein